EFGIFVGHGFVGQALIDAEIALAPRAVEDRVGFDTRLADECGGFVGAAEVGRKYPVEVVCRREMDSGAFGLLAAAVVQRRRCPALEPSLGVPVGLAVSEGDNGRHGRRCSSDSKGRSVRRRAGHWEARTYRRLYIEWHIITGHAEMPELWFVRDGSLRPSVHPQRDRRTARLSAVRGQDTRRRESTAGAVDAAKLESSRLSPPAHP